MLPSIPFQAEDSAGIVMMRQSIIASVVAKKSRARLFPLRGFLAGLGIGSAALSGEASIPNAAARARFISAIELKRCVGSSASARARTSAS